MAAFAVLTPSWVAFTSTAMAEGAFTALALAGLLAWRGEPGGERAGLRHGAAAGLAFGAATLVRPVGAVLFVTLWWVRWRQGRVSRGRAPAAAVSAAAFAVLPAAWVGASLFADGGAPDQIDTYLHKDAALPLVHLLSGLARPWADPLKWMQVVFVLGLVGAALVILGRRGSRRFAPPRVAEWRAWLGSQALFHLLLPSSWVFEALPRFLVPALPGVAAALDCRLPAAGRRRRWLAVGLVTLLAVGSAGVSVWWNLRALGTP